MVKRVIPDARPCRLSRACGAALYGTRGELHPDCSASPGDISRHCSEMFHAGPQGHGAQAQADDGATSDPPHRYVAIADRSSSRAREFPSLQMCGSHETRRRKEVTNAAEWEREFPANRSSFGAANVEQAHLATAVLIFQAGCRPSQPLAESTGSFRRCCRMYPGANPKDAARVARFWKRLDTSRPDDAGSSAQNLSTVHVVYCEAHSDHGVRERANQAEVQTAMIVSLASGRESICTPCRHRRTIFGCCHSSNGFPPMLP